VLNVLAFIPGIGGIIQLLVGIWVLVAGVIAVRQALDFDTGKAILTAVVGWLALLLISVLLAVLVGGTFAAIGGFAG
jgi:hypothetical protein